MYYPQGVTHYVNLNFCEESPLLNPENVEWPSHGRISAQVEITVQAALDRGWMWGFGLH